MTQVFSLYNTGSPRVALDLDRNKAQLLGVSPNEVYDTLGIYLGSRYVNDFNMNGRTYRVTAQAEPDARADASNVANMKVRSNTGAMVPLGSIATLRNDTGPVRIVRYNLFPASELQGQAMPGVLFRPGAQNHGRPCRQGLARWVWFTNGRNWRCRKNSPAIPRVHLPCGGGVRLPRARRAL